MNLEVNIRAHGNIYISFILTWVKETQMKQQNGLNMAEARR